MLAGEHLFGSFSFGMNLRDRTGRAMSADQIDHFVSCSIDEIAQGMPDKLLPEKLWIEGDELCL